MRRFAIALASIAGGFFLVGILSALLIPAIEESLENFQKDTQIVVIIAASLVLLGAILGIPVLINRWLQKRFDSARIENPAGVGNPLVAYVCLGTISLGILAYSFVFSTNRITNFEYLLGENLVYGFIIYVAFAALLGRHQSNVQKFSSFAAILSSLMIGSYVAAERQVQQTLHDDQVIVRMQENIQRVFESADSVDGRLDPIAVDSAAIHSRDTNVALEAWLNGYLNELIAQQNDYFTELEAVNYFGLLDGERIRTDSDLVESAFILSRTREIIDKYERLGSESLYSARDKIQTLNIAESAKREALAGLERNMQTGLDNTREIWVLEREIVSVTENLIEFLDSTESNWTWEEEKFAFSSTKNLNIFNSYLSGIQEAANAQASIRDSSSQRVDNILQKAVN